MTLTEAAASRRVRAVETFNNRKLSDHDGTLSAIIAGQWTCLTGHGTTNCETGAVRTARFKPADSFLTGHSYLVELNP